MPAAHRHRGGGVARVPQAREVLEVRAARLSSANIDVVVQALESPRPRHYPVRDGARRHRRDADSCGFFYHQATLIDAVRETKRSAL